MSKWWNDYLSFFLHPQLLICNFNSLLGTKIPYLSVSFGCTRIRISFVGQGKIIKSENHFFSNEWMGSIELFGIFISSIMNITNGPKNDNLFKTCFSLGISVKTLLEYDIPGRLFAQVVSWYGTFLESLYAFFRRIMKKNNQIY